MLARGSSSPRWKSAAPLFVGILLSVYVFAATTSVREKSITFDELAHLTGGVSSWVAHDYRLFPQNGQFPQRWAALPLVVLGFRFPSLDQPAWRTSNLEAIGYQFLYAVGNDHEALLRRGRLAMIPVGVLLGWLCYAWARRLFGAAAGIVALFVFVFSPSILAHGPLATSDLTAALMFTASLGSLWITLHRASLLRVLGSTLVMGLLFVTKMSAFLMVPTTLILVAYRLWHRRPLIWLGRQRLLVSGRRQLLVISGAILVAHVVGVVVLIWAFYGFRYATFAAGVPGHDQQFLGETIDTLTDGEITRPAIILARDLRVLPEAYLFGLAHVFNRSGRFVGFLNGRYSLEGWWHFFPYCWLVKTPLALLALLGLAAISGWQRLHGSERSRRRVRRALYRVAPLFVFLVVYWTAAVMSRLNLGERHLLPTYPALFILAGGAASSFGTQHRVRSVVVGSLLLLLSIESIGIWPHYLAYFNSFAGGPSSGYRHLVDSSLDWGQDLPGLKRWLERPQSESGSRSPVYLSYFGSGNPALYGIEARQIYSYQDWRSDRPLYELTGGIYCISATMLQSVYTQAPGPWAVPYERAYQTARLEIERYQTLKSDPAHAGVLSDQEIMAWRRLVNDFEQLRLARLCAYLRHREPDDQVGYSILIYRLSNADVRDALNGAPAELLPDVGVEGLL